MPDENELISLSKDLVDWLTERFCSLYCDNYSCNTCPFGRSHNGFKKSCDMLTGDERLSVLRQMHGDE